MISILLQQFLKLGSISEISPFPWHVQETLEAVMPGNGLKVPSTDWFCIKINVYLYCITNIAKKSKIK